ncbi:rhodanese-like domain-containing protein [Saccharopolyspora erythraea]|uniref:Rhodanese-like protein n=2 Tax=Saccharopolyspora erythraea TaxID=1836 RepID=A4FLQ7_SACEN|nr:rhodanese-like domain-containing protein [Saccharopolyspora erythraea]EQD88146.1 sulfurtransferase [Saccharopolyspora erythraea D]QRK93879.1 rhodanese-like domain-containing protein [Saccharopolyspora erythraea]CAM04982.1 rhodanese-like protein [Saccharopolyspora erythraea NRRL 2338]
MDTGRVRELLDSDPRARLIDVRTPGEFEAERIPGSHNVPLDLLRERRSSISPAHTDPVVLVCGSGARAEQARDLLEDNGFQRLTVLSGGVGGWQEQGAPVERGTGKWAMERQVRLVAGSIVLAGVLGSLRYPKLKLLAGFIGGGLTFSALTNTCGMARLLSLLPYNRTPAQDAPGLLAALTADNAAGR